jgi:hypothetical protein
MIVDVCRSSISPVALPETVLEHPDRRAIEANRHSDKWKANMSKVRLNPILEGMRGKVGDLVFKRFEGQTIVSRRPQQVHQPNSPAQLAAREKFRQAAAYAKAAFANPAIRALYAPKAKAKNLSTFALMIADFFKAPTIDEVDLSAYTGQTGQVIRVRAIDDFEVMGVSVQMLEPDTHEQIDGGDAVKALDGTWVFTAQANIPHGHTFTIEVTATDRPGHKTVKTLTHTAS